MTGTSQTSMEFSGESFNYEFSGDGAGEMFDESTLNELAAELLAVQNDEELEQFLGSIASKIGDAAKAAVSSPVVKGLGKVLKPVAKQLLPVAGRLAGDYFAPGVGGYIGSMAGAGIARAIGLELEGLNPEERDLEAAKRVVQIAAETSRRALAAPPGLSPQTRAHAALRHVLRKYSSGLTGELGQQQAQSGRWVRRGNSIVLLGL